MPDENIINDFSAYMRVIRNRSPKTVEQYEQDLRLFFKYLTAQRNNLPVSGEEFDNRPLECVSADFAASVTTEDVYRFLLFSADKRQNNAKTRARKLSALRSFFRYCTTVKKIMPLNPAADIDAPKIGRELPKYLTAEESIELLSAVESDTESRNTARDYAIVTLFLNCGMRLSELTQMNLGDLDPELTLVRVTGKGSKERIIYLNEACRSALKSYLDARRSIDAKPEHKNAVFLSRLGRRISPKTVQWIVYKYLDASGLGYKHCSVHKLRHTAATLMYQTGEVDIRVLKDILGHEQLNTTQIYTHLSDSSMKHAMELNPLSSVKGRKKAKKSKDGYDGGDR